MGRDSDSDGSRYRMSAARWTPHVPWAREALPTPRSRVPKRGEELSMILQLHETRLLTGVNHWPRDKLKTER